MGSGLMSEARNAVASATGPLFDMGVRAERERIIALLEAEGFEYRSLDESPRNLIALIKGE